MKDFRAPGEDEARDRTWKVVRAAFERREPISWPRRRLRPLVATAVVAAAAAALLSPPGRSFIQDVRKAVGVEHARTELFSLPTRGRLLVAGAGGTWVVSADGSKRRLGAYRDAAWSPHGLFIAATRGNELVALDPKGTVRWTLARPQPRFPTWTGTFTNTLIAYLAGGRLHVVAGDGTGDRTVGPAALVPPAWRPGGGHVLAYSNGRSVVVYDLDRRKALLHEPAGLIGTESTRTRVTKLAWSADGRLLLAFRTVGLRVYDRRGSVVSQDDPSDATHYLDAAFAPGSHRLAIIRDENGSSVVWNAAHFRGTGVFRQLAYSPNGKWLLITWPTADQWVFKRIQGRRRLVGDSRISKQFGSFPRIEGWCCPR
jgi:hypothetical protein